MSGDGIHGGQGVCCPTFATAHSEQEQGRKKRVHLLLPLSVSYQLQVLSNHGDPWDDCERPEASDLQSEV